MIKNIFVVFLIFVASGSTEQYDFVIIGGGTTGCVVAGRLSESPSTRVLLLERGQDVTDDESVKVPTVNSILPLLDVSLFPSEHIHSYEPFLSSKNLPTFVPFAVGGGPAISASFWGRGEPSNYDEWAAIVGDSTLNYTNLLPYFKKSENVDPAQSSSQDRGFTGPMEVTFLNSNDSNVNPLELLQSQVFNVTIGDDYTTSEGLVGIWPMQRTLYRDPLNCSYSNGPCRRVTSYTSYIKPYLRSRPNLTVISGAVVLDLVFQNTRRGKKVIGVDYLHNGVVVRARSTKETIISAGTINSAKLLLLSGIGDQTDLNKLNIPLVRHSPGVGKNLQDHFYLNMVYYMPTAASIQHPSSVRISFFKSGFNGNATDVEIAWGLLPASSLLGAGAPGVVVVVQNIQVRNTSNGGFLNLRSKNPFERVNIQFNYDTNHLKPMIWSLKKIRSWLGQVAVEISPGFSALPANATDQAIMNYISANGRSFYHMGGTCKMGPLSDPTSVVDSNFNVIGVKNLRVVDNSVQPKLVCSHPSGTAVMLGERAADLIKEIYN